VVDDLAPQVQNLSEAVASQPRLLQTGVGLLHEGRDVGGARAEPLRDRAVERRAEVVGQ